MDDIPTLSDGPDRPSMGTPDRPHPRRPTGRPTPALARPRAAQRHLLPAPGGLCLAFVAPRLSALANRLLLLPPVAGRRHLGHGPRRAAPWLAGRRRPCRRAQRGH